MIPSQIQRSHLTIKIVAELRDVYFSRQTGGHLTVQSYILLLGLDAFGWKLLGSQNGKIDREGKGKSTCRSLG